MIVKVMMDKMFFMSNDVVTVLKTFLENLAKNGLATVKSGNAFFSIQHIFTFYWCLLEVRQLPTETLTHILSGLTPFSVDEFRQHFG